MHSFLNKIIKTCNFQSYLEIGVDDPNNNFNHIRAAFKTGVDPYEDDTECHAWNKINRQSLIEKIDPKADFYQLTSDDFFKKFDKQKNKPHFDLIYIDGLHTEEQVDKDIANALRYVSPNGMIVLDDVPPVTEYEEKTPPDPGQPWRGTVWRSFAKLRLENTGNGRNAHGLFTVKSLFKSIILPNRQHTPTYKNKNFPNIELSYQFLKAYENELLNNVTEEQFFNIITTHV